MDIFKSKGVKRTLASLFAGLAIVLPMIPGGAAYAELASQIAGVLGIAGVAHAAFAAK